MKSIADLEPGDEVAVWPGGAYGEPSLDVVDRVTKTQIVLTRSKNKYNRRTGMVVGGSAMWGRSHIREADDVTRTKVRRNQLVAEIGRLSERNKLKELSTEHLERIFELFNDEVYKAT